MKSDYELIKLTIEKEPDKIKDTILNEIYIIDESFFGADYKTIILPLKKEAKVFTIKGKKANAYKCLYDPKNDIFYPSRRSFIKDKIDKNIFSYLTLPYSIIATLIATGYFFNLSFLILAFLLPIIYGYMIFGMCYCYMKDYLKKFSDLVVLTSGALTAILTIIPFLPIEKLNQDTLYKDLTSFFNENVVFDTIITLGKILSIEAFICFYVIKFCIACSETIQSKIEYDSKEKPSTFIVKKRNRFHEWCAVKIASLSVKYHDMKDKYSA